MTSRLGLICFLLISALGILECKPTTETSAAAATTNDKFPEEDSDMLMEPNDFAPVSVIRSHGRQFFPSTTAIYRDEPARTEIDPPQAAQNFYPSYFRDVPPLGHSRPYFPPPLPLDGPLPPQKFAAPHPTRGFDPSILGSGDFGVIRGGTFYPEDEMPYHPEDNSDFNQFYGDNSNNGHGRPQNDGFVHKFTYPEEQFANFRDFADINTPADSAFSQFVVVYAAKNATSQSSVHHPRPKNIFEQLELLDKEKDLEEKKNRISKSKVKLTSTKFEKKYKKKSTPKDVDYEPLLALS